MMTPENGRPTDLSGRTAREIGDMIGRDERSVQNAVYRIRQKLRRELPSP